MFFQKLAQPIFVGRVHGGPEEAHRHGLHMQLLQPRNDVNDRWLINGHIDCSVGTNAFGNLKCQRTRNVRLGKGNQEIERLASATFSQNEYVGMALCRQESCLGRILGDDGVGCVGGSVHKQVALCQKILGVRGQAIGCNFENVQNALDRIVRGRRRLEHV